MKHFYLKNILLCLLSFTGLGISAHDFYVDGIYYNITSEKDLTVAVTYKGISYDSYKNEYTGSITIPETVFYDGRTYSVTSIGGDAFFGCSGLTSVTIPNSVTSIELYAFCGCSGLTSVTIPNSVTSIGGNAFFGCSGLTTPIYNSTCFVFMPSSYTGTFTIPSGIKTIIGRAFYNCSGLTSVIIPNSVTSIGYGAFSGCSGLTSVTIPNSVTSIGDYAFSGCSGLTSMTIPNSVTSIGYYAFYGCSGLTSMTIPNSVTSIGSDAFSGCSGLTSMTIPNSVTSIGSDAFSGCSGLTSVTISNSVTSILDHTFQNCTSLTSVTIPNSVTYISDNAFEGTAWYNSLHDGIIYINNMLYKYKGLMPNNTSITIRHGTEIINDYAFKNCSGLTSVTIPNSVTSIGGCAFEGCSGLTSLTIPNSVTSIESYAFYGCSGLTSVTIPNSVTSIGNAAFGGCVGLLSSTVSSASISIVLEHGSSLVPKTVLRHNKEWPAVAMNEDGSTSFNGLEPSKEYWVEYVMLDGRGGRNVIIQGNVVTKNLKLVTSQPKVISPGNVIVAAETNLDDEETNVGFEWRRTDWTDDFASNTGDAALYAGTMEGYIRNLNTEKLWKFRPYYLSNSGTYYYGDWIGVDPTNTSYFSPTVHTYTSISVTGNTALVKGYALGGTDAVTVQGFMYWKNVSGGEAQRRAISIPTNAKTVVANGQVMTAELIGLDYNSEYTYVAFVETVTGEIFYGEEQAFTTGEAPTDIEEIAVGNVTNESVIEIARYNMNGQKIDAPQKGINIIRYSNGTTRSVYVK